MTELDADFEQKAEAVLQEYAEERARELGEQLKRLAAENFKEYASREGHDIDHVWSEATMEIDDSTVRIEWPGLTALFEYGVDPHTIEGNPLLAFQWEGPPEGTRPPGAPEFVQTDSVNWGSVTGGIDEARAIRDALDVTRVELGGAVQR